MDGALVGWNPGRGLIALQISRCVVRKPTALRSPCTDDADEKHRADEGYAEFERGGGTAVSLTDQVFREAGEIHNAAPEAQQREDARPEDAVRWHFQAEQGCDQETAAEREAAEQEGHPVIFSENAGAVKTEREDRGGGEEDEHADEFHRSAQEMWGV